LTYPWGVYSIRLVTIDKWIVLIVGVGAIIALNVNFIRRMNRRGRENKKPHDENQQDKNA
jgi:hypothetical protein